MNTLLTRRALLRGALGAAATSALAGCSNLLADRGDVVVRNRRDSSHTVEFTLYHGGEYPHERGEVTVPAGEEDRVEDVTAARSDHPYQIEFTVDVDGSRAETEGFEWHSGITLVVTLHGDGSVSIKSAS